VTQSVRARSQTTVAPPAKNGFSTLGEKPLHAQLKEWYARPGDRLEEPVDDFIVDIYRDGHCLEIQTANFSAIRRKLWWLVETHPVRLIHPIPLEKQIVRLDGDGVTELGRRRSPKRRGLLNLCEQLIYLPTLLAEPNFSLEVLLIKEEERRIHRPDRNWRRKGWAVVERRLLEVIESRLFEEPADLLALLPRRLPPEFTTADIAELLPAPRRQAQQLVYCLRALELIRITGKRSRSLLYEEV